MMTHLPHVELFLPILVYLERLVVFDTHVSLFSNIVEFLDLEEFLSNGYFLLHPLHFELVHFLALVAQVAFDLVVDLVRW